MTDRRADPPSPAMLAMMEADDNHARLCDLGADDLALRRAYIAALEAHLVYLIECGETPEARAAMESEIARSRRALAILESRRTGEVH